MKRIALAILIVVLLLPLEGWARAAPRLYWDHDGLNVTWFAYVLDGGTAVNMGLPTPEGRTYSYLLPALTDGTHTFAIQACNILGCASSLTMTVVKL